MHTSLITRFRLLALALVALCVAPLAAQQPSQNPQPRLNSIFPPGGQVGTAVEVTVLGTDLDDAKTLYFSRPGFTVAPVMGEKKPYETEAQPVPGKFSVQIAADVPPGLYEVRASGRFGLSNPRVFQVETLTEQRAADNNNTPETAQEVAVNSVTSGASRSQGFSYYRFAAKTGQRLGIEVFAKRLDSRMDATLVLTDPTGREMGFSRAFTGGDPRIDLTAPRDGNYTLKLYDFVYGGGTDYGYRLAIAERPSLDLILPAAAVPGTKSKFTLFGRRLPGGKPSTQKLPDGQPLEELEVEIDVPALAATLPTPLGQLGDAATAMAESFEYRLNSPAGPSNVLSIAWATEPVVREQEPNTAPDKAQKLTLPCDLTGQFAPRADQDFYEFEAQQGDIYWIEVVSQRMGFPADPFLQIQQVVKQPDGSLKLNDVVNVDDVQSQVGGLAFNASTDDAAAKFIASATGTYRLLVRDLYFGSRGDPRAVYRLVIRKARPDFRLAVVPRSPNNQNNSYEIYAPQLWRGGSTWVDILAYRQDGFTGPIEVSVANLPAGVTCPPAYLGPGETATSLVFTATEDAAAWAGALQVTGKADIDGQQITRPARAGTVVWPSSQNSGPGRARMARDMTLAVVDQETAPFQLLVDTSKPLEMSRGGTLSIPVKVKRRHEFKGDLALKAVYTPKDLQVADVTLKGDEGKLDLQLRPALQPGQYTFHVKAVGQWNYAKNPAAAARAADEKKRITEFAEELAKGVKVALAAKTEADKKATEAVAAGAEATKQLAKAKQAADKDQANPGLKEAVAAAENVVKETAAAVESTKLAKATAEEAHKAAEAALKDATAMKTAAEKRATELDTASKPKNIMWSEVTPALTVTVAPAPIQVTAVEVPGSLKTGDKLEVTARFERLFGYADTIDWEMEAPKNSSGFTIAKVTTGKEGSEAKLVIAASPKATAGEQTFIVSALVKLGGQPLRVSFPFVVKVIAE